MKRALFLSIRPRYVKRILEGLKRVEFRRVRPKICIGELLLIYSSSPKKELECHSVVTALSKGTPDLLWSQFREASGLTRSEFKSYFLGADVGFAIHFGKVARFDAPITLSALRELWPGFSPPQIYRYLNQEEYLSLLNLTVRR